MSLDKQSAIILMHALVSTHARRLLQLSPCSCARDDDRQTTTCVKCRCPCHQQYQKVWPRSLAATTWWLALAGHSWPSCFQADSHCLSVSERPCTELSVEPCHPSQRYRVTAAPSVCCNRTHLWSHVTDWLHTAVEHFLLRVPQRGTVFLSHSETRQSAMPASDGI